MELCVFGLVSDEDWNVRVGVFPKCLGILILLSGLGGVALHGISAGEAEVGECADGFVLHDTALVKDFLELIGGFAGPMRGQIRFPPHIDGIQSRRESTAAGKPQLVRSGYLENADGSRRIA